MHVTLLMIIAHHCSGILPGNKPSTHEDRIGSAASCLPSVCTTSAEVCLRNYRGLSQQAPRSDAHSGALAKRWRCLRQLTQFQVYVEHGTTAARLAPRFVRCWGASSPRVLLGGILAGLALPAGRLPICVWRGVALLRVTRTAQKPR